MKRLLIGALLLLIPRAAIGATFVVNSTVDAVDGTPGDGVCAAASGACTLRAAVQEANALPGAHAITLPAGMIVAPIRSCFRSWVTRLRPMSSRAAAPQ